MAKGETKLWLETTHAIRMMVAWAGFAEGAGDSVVLVFPCPTCKAAPWEKCEARSPRGHAPRQDLWIRSADTFQPTVRAEQIADGRAGVAIADLRKTPLMKACAAEAALNRPPSRSHVQRLAATLGQFDQLGPIAER